MQTKQEEATTTIYLFGSSAYPRGTSKCESGISSRNANSWNVIFAETVGKIGMSGKTKNLNSDSIIVILSNCQNKQLHLS